jgi:hypothetical protein
LRPEISTGLATVALFLLLGGGSLVYMSLISGFIYIVVMSLGSGPMRWGSRAIILLLFFNFGLVGFKYFVVLRDYKERSPKLLGAWMSKRVPADSKVVADDKYYYAVTGDGSQFQYYVRGGTEAERVAYHTDIWKADYLLVEDTATFLFRKYRDHAKLRLLDEYKPSGMPAPQGAYTTSYRGFLFGFSR